MALGEKAMVGRPDDGVVDDGVPLPSGSALAKVAQVSYAFGTPGASPLLPVLDDVSFDVHASELVTIIGPSGCGKTTLLRIVAGLISHEDVIGAVEVAGHRVIRPSQEVGYVFQHGELIPWRSVRGNVEFAL